MIPALHNALVRDLPQSHSADDAAFIRYVAQYHGAYFIINRMSRRMWEPAVYDAVRPPLPKRRRLENDPDYAPAAAPQPGR